MYEGEGFPNSKVNTLRPKVLKVLTFLYGPFIYIVFIGTFFLLLTSLMTVSSWQEIHTYLWIPFCLVSLILMLALVFERLRRLIERGIIIIRVISVVSVLLGLIPTIDAWYFSLGYRWTLTPFYIINAIFVLLVSFLISPGMKERSVVREPASRGGFVTYPFLKVAYHSGPYAGKEEVFPVTCEHVSIVMGCAPGYLNCMVSERFASSLTSLTSAALELSKGMGKYRLMLGMLLFRVEDRDKHGRHTCDLSRINIYVNGQFSSSVTFQQEHGEPFSIPIMPGITRIVRKLAPILVVVGIKRGRHTMVMELIESSGNILDVARLNFEVYEWMREGEDWWIVPVKLSLPEFRYPKPATIYYRREILSEPLTVEDTDRISVEKLKITTSSDKIEPGKSRIKDLEIILNAVERYYITTIEVTIDDSLQLRFSMNEPLPLFKHERDMLKIPLLYPLRLQSGKHTAILKIFGDKLPYVLLTGGQELLAYVKDFTCKASRRGYRGTKLKEDKVKTLFREGPGS